MAKKRYKLLLSSVLFCCAVVQTDQRYLRPGKKKYRIEEALLVHQMTEDNDDDQTFFHPHAVLFFTCCSGLVGGYAAEAVLPPSWDVSGDGASSNVKFGSTIGVGVAGFCCLDKRTNPLRKALKKLIGKED